MKEHILNVRIWGWNKYRARSGFHQLKRARSIQTITLCYDIRLAYYFGRTYSTVKAAEAMKPLLKAIRAKRGQIGVEDNVWDIVSVAKGESRREEIREIRIDCTTALRDELKGSLA